MIGLRWNQLRRCLFAALLAFAVFWGGSLLWCEYLTARWGEQFRYGWQEVSLLAQPDRWKVLSYTPTSARVYYANDGVGTIFTFNRDGEGPWTLGSWDTAWSSSGSMDGFVWPYIR